VNEILDLLYTNLETYPSVRTWVFQKVETVYTLDVRQISGPQFGLCFNASHLHSEKIHEFLYTKLSSKLERDTLALWNLLISLLAPDPSTVTGVRLTKYRKGKRKDNTGTDAVVDYEMDNENLEDGGKILDHEAEIDEMAVHDLGLITVVCQYLCHIASIMAHSTNMRCNALQTAIGFFLEASNAPKTVCELLAHSGMSVSAATTSRMLGPLRSQCEMKLKGLG
ncbi:hypothetical protein BS47DRAFT_1264867, partial [Hydnum rufescens UP504]